MAEDAAQDGLEAFNGLEALGPLVCELGPLLYELGPLL